MQSSQVKDKKFSIKDIGMTYEDIRIAGSSRNSLNAAIIGKVLQMELTDLRCLYNGLGINGASGLTMDSLHCVMLWMYLTGKAKRFGLSKLGVLEYNMRKGGTKWESRSSTILRESDSMIIEKRLAYLLGLTKEQSWICRYAAETLINGEKSEKLILLKRLLMNTRKRPLRDDYAEILPYLENTEFRDSHGTRVVYDTRIFMNMLDIIRIAMRHAYSGPAPSDYIMAIKGSTDCKNKVRERIAPVLQKLVPMINMANTDNISAKLFLNSIKLS